MRQCLCERGEGWKRRGDLGRAQDDCVCVRVCVCVVDGMQPNSQTKYEWHGNEANSFQCIVHALFVLFMANM